MIASATRFAADAGHVTDACRCRQRAPYPRRFLDRRATLMFHKTPTAIPELRHEGRSAAARDTMVFIAGCDNHGLRDVDLGVVIAVLEISVTPGVILCIHMLR